MKKRLDVYNDIEGLGEYDAWSYCARKDMWYEDAKEVLPKPFWFPRRIKDLYCEMKLDYFSYNEQYKASEIEAEDEDSSVVNYAKYVVGENNAEDTFSSVLILEDYAVGLSPYGVWGLESFVKKLKEQDFATEYIEQWSCVKLIAWTNKSNQTRFVAHCYMDDHPMFGRMIFDISLCRDMLVGKLTSAIEYWKDALRRELEHQKYLLQSKGYTPHHENAIDHFFPGFYASLTQK